MSDGSDPLDRDELVALRNLLLRAALALTGSAAEAEDLVQAAFERWSRRERSLPSRTAQPLLYTTLKRLAIDHARRKRRWRMAELPEFPTEHESPPPWATVSTEQLAAALSRCNERDRKVFQLYYSDGLSYREIALRLELPMGTIATRLHRARALLRAALERALE